MGALLLTVHRAVTVHELTSEEKLRLRAITLRALGTLSLVPPIDLNSYAGDPDELDAHDREDLEPKLRAALERIDQPPRDGSE